MIQRIALDVGYPLIARTEGDRWAIIQEHCEPGDFESHFGDVAKVGGRWRAWFADGPLAVLSRRPQTRDEAARLLIEAIRGRGR